MDKGKLYIFFAESGTGKDFLAQKFINFSNCSEKKVAPVPKLFARPAREEERNDPYNQYGLTKNQICTSNNYYAEINGSYTGISRQRLAEDLASGKSLVLSTGSIDLLHQIVTGNSESLDTLCLIFIPNTKNELQDYKELETKRNPNQKMEEIDVSARQRLSQSQRIKEFYSKYSKMFHYSYLNVTKYTADSARGKFDEVFFDAFFETIIKSRREGGPNWIANEEEIQRDALREFMNHYRESEISIQTVVTAAVKSGLTKADVEQITKLEEPRHTNDEKKKGESIDGK